MHLRLRLGLRLRLRLGLTRRRWTGQNLHPLWQLLLLLRPLLDSYSRRITLLMINGWRRAGKHGIPLIRYRGRTRWTIWGRIVVPGRGLGLEVRLRRRLVELRTAARADVESLL